MLNPLRERLTNLQQQQDRGIPGGKIGGKVRRQFKIRIPPVHISDDEYEEEAVWDAQLTSTDEGDSSHRRRIPHRVRSHPQFSDDDSSRDDWDDEDADAEVLTSSILSSSSPPAIEFPLSSTLPPPHCTVATPQEAPLDHSAVANLESAHHELLGVNQQLKEKNDRLAGVHRPSHTHPLDTFFSLTCLPFAAPFAAPSAVCMNVYLRLTSHSPYSCQNSRQS